VQILHTQIPKVQKAAGLECIFALLGSASVKAAGRMLMKLTPAFSPIFICQKIQTQTVRTEKQYIALLYKKADHKLLVQLTPTLSSFQSKQFRLR